MLHDSDDPDATRCDYTRDATAEDSYLDPVSAPQTSFLAQYTDEGKWVCPWAVEDEQEYCCFHRDLSTTDEASKDTDSDLEFLSDIWLPEHETTACLNERLDELSSDDDSPSWIPLVGATFGRLDIDTLDLSGFEQITLDLRHATIGSLEVDRLPPNLRLIFDGATFGSEVSLIGQVFDSRVSFAGATFEHGAEFLRSEFREGGDFHDASFGERAGFEETVFAAKSDERVRPTDANFHGAVFDGGATFENATFEGRALFGDTRFVNGPSARFVKSRFGALADFEEATFDLELDVLFSDAKFDSEVVFADTEVLNGTAFDAPRAEFRDRANFGRIEINGTCSFRQASFWEEATFEEATVDPLSKTGLEPDPPIAFEGVTFRGRARFYETTFADETAFSDGRFGARAVFTAATFDTDVRFENCDFEGDPLFASGQASVQFDEPPVFREAAVTQARFTGTTLDGADFADADLTGADLGGADLRGADLERARLSRANLRSADLRGSALAGAILSDARVDTTTEFLQLPYETAPAGKRLPRTIASVFPWTTPYTPACGYDPAFDPPADVAPDIDWPETSLADSLSVYTAIEEITSNAAASRQRDLAFVRRKDIQAKQHCGELTRTDSSRLDSLFSAVDCFVARLSRAVMLYGHSPWRIIGWSIALIALFAGVYPLDGWIVAEDGGRLSYSSDGSILQFGTVVYYSTLTFTALGFGDFRPAGFGRLLTTLETGVGAVLVALLVFVLGRRATR